MVNKDKELGLGTKISRRDFVGGALVLSGAAAAPGLASTLINQGSDSRSDYYPPAKTGLRGNHPGSFEPMHALRDGASIAAGAVDSSEPTYDLVVVGGGLSGLSAAHFYIKQNPNARVLILENHDDFGGHAKRNELPRDNNPFIAPGGSGLLQNPQDYSDDSKQLLQDLAIDIETLGASFDENFHRRHGLRYATYFDQPTYGTDKLVFGDYLETLSFFDYAPTDVSVQDWVSQLPIAQEAREQIKGLFVTPEDRIPDVHFWNLPEFLGGMSYDAFLKDHLGITHPQARGLFARDFTEIGYGVGTDSVTALECLAVGMPGLSDIGLDMVKGLITSGVDKYLGGFYFFPDGNASVARLLVRSLIPEVAPGNTMQDVVKVRFDYSKLDQSSNQTRIRLNSTVLQVKHRGSPNTASLIDVDYSIAGDMHRVQAKNVVMACYNMAIPYLCPDLPEPQQEALKSLVKMPIAMTNVALRNWEPLKKAGLAAANCPGSHFHSMFSMDAPVQFGGYSYNDDPSKPATVGFAGAPGAAGLTPRERFRQTRYRLLSMSFEDFERDIRTQLSGMLAPYGFDPARDITAITVNRWAHGYAYQYLPLFDGPFDEGQAPHEIGRKPFGRIAIANSDSHAWAYLDGAVDAAARAVRELT